MNIEIKKKDSTGPVLYVATQTQYTILQPTETEAGRNMCLIYILGRARARIFYVPLSSRSEENFTKKKKVHACMRMRRRDFPVIPTCLTFLGVCG